MWAETECLSFPGWPVPFRPLIDLLPEEDVAAAVQQPQLVPILWYPALVAERDVAAGTLLDVFDSLPKGHPLASAMLRREELSRTYSWAVATASAIRWIADVTKGRELLEVGAGAGYWARQLRLAGVDILPTDVHRAGANGYAGGFRYSDVQVTTAVEAVRRHPTRTLMMVWPPLADSMAVEALRAYTGDTFLYIGDGPQGLCADPAFVEELRRHWRLTAVCPLAVRWLGYTDQPRLFRRRSQEPVGSVAGREERVGQP
ncbi:hypothetical protein [Streptomyces sp. UH6]|uniref:hypothetical protein n=1 Tax=Streptomyces sp. UH6 TaxID=2748379 RepID=UPI0015D4F578|nr:hypothetical protein [Streptomyces sp. UH6]